MDLLNVLILLLLMYLVQLPQTDCNSLLGPSEVLHVTGDASIWSLVLDTFFGYIAN